MTTRRVLAVAVVLVLTGACGGGGESGGTASSTTVATGLTKQQTCEGVQAIHNSARQFEQDFALGKADTGRAFLLAAEIQARGEMLAAQTTDPKLGEAIREWNVQSGTAISDDRSRAQMDAAFAARDKVDDLCGIPHQPRRA